MKTVNDSLLEIYCREISQYKVLSAEEECQMIARICSGDMVAREKLIQSYLRLVVRIARHPKFCCQEDIMDLIQEGNIGLIQAVDSYVSESGSSFAGFAGICIRNRLLSFVQKSREMLVLDSLVYEDSDEYVTLADRVADEASILGDASYRQVEEDWICEEGRNSMLQALESLPWREREMLQLLYGLGVRHAMNMQEVAILQGISLRRVAQIYQRALQHAHRALGKELTSEGINELRN